MYSALAPDRPMSVLSCKRPLLRANTIIEANTFGYNAGRTSICGEHTCVMAIPSVLYLAHGSNLHPFRINARVPSATPLGVAHFPGLSLTFHKRSKDGSGKCTFIETETDARGVWCAVYELTKGEKARLDQIEGLGDGYIEQQLKFEMDGRLRLGRVYRSASSHVDPKLHPYHWYKSMVLLGAHFHKFPDDYVLAIEQLESIDDPDRRRAAENEQILQNMRQINRSSERATD